MRWLSFEAENYSRQPHSMMEITIKANVIATTPTSVGTLWVTGSKLKSHRVRSDHGLKFLTRFQL